jgi:hypothetical protein
MGVKVTINDNKTNNLYTSNNYNYKTQRTPTIIPRTTTITIMEPF